MIQLCHNLELVTVAERGRSCRVDFVSSGGTENELGRSAMAIIHPRSVPVWVRIVLATFPFLRYFWSPPPSR